MILTGKFSVAGITKDKKYLAVTLGNVPKNYICVVGDGGFPIIRHRCAFKEAGIW